MILAQFDHEAALQRALQRCRVEGVKVVETYTPAPLQDQDTASPIPLMILIAGLCGFAASFALQSYSSAVAYGFLIGGRPRIAWPSFLPTAFENGVLVAMIAGFLAFLLINRMPRLYDPVDEADLIRSASRDGWVLRVQAADDRVRALLHELDARRVEEVAG